MRGLTRRTFLRGGILACALPLLAACTSNVPPAVPKPARAALAQLPTNIPITRLTPDLPGTPDGLVAPGFITYPKDKLFQSVKTPPGRGGDVSLTLETSNPPVPPLTENTSWQAVNKAANARLNVTTLPFGDFNAKWASIQAGT